MLFDCPDISPANGTETATPAVAVTVNSAVVSTTCVSLAVCALLLLVCLCVRVRPVTPPLALTPPAMVVAGWSDAPAALVGHALCARQVVGGGPAPAPSPPPPPPGGRMAGRAGLSAAVGSGVAPGAGPGPTPQARAAAAAAEHRLLRQSAARDAELGLPSSPPLPDGEEFPYSANYLHIRSPDQEKEIYEPCIRAPPNRTVYSRELPTPPHSRLIDNALVATAERVKGCDPMTTAPMASAACGLTVVVPRYQPLWSAPPSQTPAPVRPPPPPPPAVTSTADLLRYDDGGGGGGARCPRSTGARLARLPVVGCRTVTSAAPPSWHRPTADAASPAAAAAEPTRGDRSCQSAHSVLASHSASSLRAVSSDSDNSDLGVGAIDDTRQAVISEATNRNASAAADARGRDNNGDVVAPRSPHADSYRGRLRATIPRQ